MKLIQDGPRNAKIMLVGEAPGADEERGGKPFVGYSGQLLDGMLDRVGIRRHECFITNVCHVRPPGNEFKWFFQKKDPKARLHLAYGMLQLKEDIELIKPNLVIALGGQPLKVLTGKNSITNWRGSILDSVLVPGTKILGTYHPAAILRTWDYKAVAELDLAKARRESTFPEIRRIPREFILNPPYDQRSQIIAEMVGADWLAVDIECWQNDSGKWELACIGFSDRKDRALVIAYDKHDVLVHSDIRRLLESGAKKVLQNGTFDVTVLRESGYDVRNFVWDTMLAHHALYPECAGGGDEIAAMGGKKRQAALSKGLAFLTTLYTDIPRYKDDGKLWKKTGDIEMFWRYNGLDCMATWEVRDGQEHDLRAFGTTQVKDHAMSLVEPLMAMTKTGIKIDAEKREEFRKKYTDEAARLQDFLDTLAGQPLNVSSNKQITWFLYDKLGLPKQYVKKKTDNPDKPKNPSANKDIVVKLAAKFKNPGLLTILKIREKRTMLERYVDVKLDDDGRMRCNFDITGTRSGRLSSRASLSGSGTNLQNIPAEMREMFVADPGKVFVYRDFSQAEARIVAYLSNDKYLIDLFKDPSRDIHRETAAKIFNVPLDQVTPEQRFLGKKVRHAVNYDMKADRFVEVVNEDAETTGTYITHAMAQKVLDGFFLLHPNHKSVYWGRIAQELKRSRTLNTPFGRKRTFFGRYDEKLLREAYSYIPQSTIGDLCCKALVGMYERIEIGRPDLEASILLNVHDSILVQCRIGTEREVSDLMGEAMRIPINIEGETIYIPTDSKIGYNWMDKGKDGSNPRGLVDISKWEG